MPALIPQIDQEINVSVEIDSSTTSRPERRNAEHSSWTALSVLVVALAILVLVSVGLLFQFTTYLNHDIAWILYSADLMLDGGVFGRDVIAANPPLAWYLSYPAVILAELTGAHLANVFRVYVALVTFTFMAWSGWLLQRSDTRVRAGSVLLLVVATSTFFVSSYRDYGQREFFALVLAFPYLVLTASRLAGRGTNRSEAICIGAFAGVAVALKPHFLAVPVFVELAGMIYARRLSFFVRPEAFTGTATIVSYVAFLTVFVPDYVFNIVPLCRQIYWGFNQELTPIIGSIRYEIAGLGLLIYILVRKPRLSPLIPILVAAALGFLLAYITQHKGYTYHALPFRSLVLITLGFLLGNLQSRVTTHNKWERFESCVISFALLALVFVSFARTTDWYLKYSRFLVRSDARKKWLGQPAEVASLIEFLNQRSSNDSFLAFSTHPFPAFPTALYVKPRWSSRTNSRIFIPAIAKMREAGVPADDPERLLAESAEREFLLRDLGEKPTIVLVDTREYQHGIGNSSFQMLDFYAEEPRFREIWSQYHAHRLVSIESSNVVRVPDESARRSTIRPGH